MKYKIFFLMMIALSVAGMAQTHRFPLYSEQSQAVTLNLADDTTLLYSVGCCRRTKVPTSAISWHCTVHRTQPPSTKRWQWTA